MTIEIYNKDCLLDLCFDKREYDAIITDAPYDYFVDDFPIQLLQAKCRGNLVVFCSPKNILFPDADEIAFWIKTPSTKNFSRHLGNFVEMILIKRQGDIFNNDMQWANYTGVYTDVINGATVHPYEKPLSLMERLVQIYTKPGDTVLDLFMGSGTTLKACALNDRNGVGYEIDPKTFKLAQKKLEQWLESGKR